ncbi:MAG: protein kinase [Planctomycetes bacterium]|nr:protein kinase [Planctomycetota bacterium]
MSALPPRDDDDRPIEERTIPAGRFTRPGSKPPLDRTLPAASSRRPSEPNATAPAGVTRPAPAPTGTSGGADGAQRIPGITLLGELARGGMGVVYHGRQDYLDRRVAVKFLARELHGEQFAARFRREAKLLAGIKHPNIVACFDAGTTDDGQSYLVMEFVEGPNLKSWLAEHGPLPAHAALRIARALAQALGHAHEQEVIHRDIKAENILLESSSSAQLDFGCPFVPKLVDLGLARLTSENADLALTSPGSVMGTPATMSPEQFDDPDHVDFRTDIYGLGCVLFEMLTARAAFPGTKLGDLVVAKRQPLGPNPRALRPELSAELGLFVQQLLAADRNARPESYVALVTALDALLETTPATEEPGLRSTAPRGTAPQQATMPAGAGKTGPGLLRTAELDFLAAGGTPAANAPPPFAESPAAAPAQARSAAASGQRGLLWLGAGLLLVAAGAGWWWTQQTSPAPVTPPVVAGPPAPETPTPANTPANQSPAILGLDGPEKLPLQKVGAFAVRATDTEQDALTYRWSSPQSRFVAFAPADAATTEVRLLDGLPNEEFTIEVAVTDGKNPPVVQRRTVTIDAYVPRRLMTGFKEQGSAWLCDDPVAWVQSTEDGTVSCTAAGTPHTAMLGLGDEAYWQVLGWLESARHNTPEFGTVGLRLEVGDRGISVTCVRSGLGGVDWTSEVTEVEAVDGAWRPVAATQPSKLQWQDEQDEGRLGYVSVKRRLGEVVVQCGCDKTRQLASRTLAVPANAPEPRLVLFASGGRGRFRDFVVF